MYNAELKFKGEGAKLVDFAMQDARGVGDFNASHFGAIKPILELLGEAGEFEYRETRANVERVGTFVARYGVVPAADLLAIFQQFHWTPHWEFGPHAEFLKRAMAEGKLDDFVVMLPELADAERRTIEGFSDTLPIIKRKRRQDRPGFSGSSFRQRQAIEHIAGGERTAGVLAEELFGLTRGAVLLSLAADMKDADPAVGSDPAKLSDPTSPRDIATLFSYALPKLAAPGGRIGFAAKKKVNKLVVKPSDPD